MPDHEKNILNMLDGAVKEVEIPESLQPENIQKMLEQSKKSTKFKWRKKYSYFMAAAMLALVIGTGAFWQHSFSNEIAADNIAALPVENGELKVEEQVASAEDYSEIYAYFENYQTARDYARKTSQKTSGIFNGFPWKDNVKTETAEDMNKDTAMDFHSEDPKPEVQDISQSETGDFSETNVRTKGIGEADVVKTDGTYLYALKENTTEIAIIDPRSDKMKLISTMNSRNNGEICEFYVDGKKVFVLTSVTRCKYDEKGTELYTGTDMELLVYDITDIDSPKLTASHTQSGFYKTSRFVDGYLYLFSEFYVNNCKKDVPETFIPAVNDTLLKEGCIYVPTIPAADQYIVVSSIKTDNPSEIVDQKAVLSEGGECYVSNNNIYIYENIWSSVALLKEGGSTSNLSDVDKTVIRRISYKDGKLTGEAQGKVDGRIHNSFCIDEYKGNLRIVTTIDSTVNQTNSVYVLDPDLKIIGKITDLAKGENIYSARFFGETGYFVTFRQVDPLFSVDFSDPKNPKIIGTLKIPGFSEYLHFYGKDLLLGIGMDADEKSGVTNGVKISMFDISNPSDVKEIHKYIIKDAYHSDVFRDYRAVLVDYQKNMIGFPASGNHENYYIFSYDKLNGFHVEMKEEVNGSDYSCGRTRGLYIGERFYVVKGNAVESYRMGTFEKVDDLLL